MTVPKPSCIRLNKINGFSKGHDGTRYLVLFRAKKCDFIYIRIKYLIGVKSGITKAISHYYAKIKLIHTIFYLMTFHNVMMLIKSVFNKDKNNLCYNVFLEKGSNELTENNNSK